MSSAKPGVKRMSVTSAFTTEADAQLASMMHIQALRQPCDLRRPRTGRVELLHQQEHEQHPGRDEGREARHQAHARAGFAQLATAGLRRRGAKFDDEKKSDL